MPKKSRSASVGTLAELNTSTDGDDGDDNSVAGSLNLNDLDILSDDEDDILEDGEDVPPPPNSELAKALMSPPEPSPGVFKRKSASSASSTRKSRKSKLKGSKSKSLSAIDYQFKSPKGGDVSEDESITEEAESPSFSSLCSPPETPSNKSNKRRSSKKRFLGLSTALKENGDASSSLPMGGEMVSSMRKTRASIINGGDSSRRSKRTVDDSSRRSKRSSSRTKTGGSEDSSRRSKRTSDKDGGSSRRSRRSSRTADSSSSTPARSSSRKKKSKKASKKDKRKSAESNASNTTSATVDMDESWASLVEKDNNTTTTTTTAAPMIATKNQPLHEECQSAGVNSMFHNSINFGNFGESGRTSSDSSLDLSEDDDDDDDDNDKDNDDKKVQEKKKELPKYLGHASLTEIDFSLMNDSKDEEDEEKKEELPSIKEEVIKPPPSRRSLQRTPSSRRGLSCGPVRQRSSRGRDEDRPSSKRGFSASPERKAHTAAEAMEVERPLLSCMKGSRGKLLPTKLKHPPHVYFNETLVITPIIPTYELASKRSDLWFRQKDFDKILNRSMAIALRVKEGKKTKKCVRGLEHFLKDKEERYAAWNAVLVEQEIQHLSGNFSDVRISDLYLAASTTCRTEAFDRAKDDSDAVLEYMTE